MILNALEGQPLPVYGDGSNVRDWLHVDDHVRALCAVLERGRVGESYNIGGRCERTNIEVVTRSATCWTGVILPEGRTRRLISYVADRPGHDRSYAIDAAKIETEVGLAGDPTTSPPASRRPSSGISTTGPGGARCARQSSASGVRHAASHHGRSSRGSRRESARDGHRRSACACRWRRSQVSREQMWWPQAGQGSM